jgi:hypothetical protein
MRDTEQSILNVFKDNPTREYNTSELAKEVFPEEYTTIENLLSSPDKIHVHEAKRKKFQLHRKLLYYLNKLIDEKILRISRIQEKGEKTFALAIEDGDITLEKGYKKIIITKPNMPINQIEQYEKQKIMKKFEEESWINRFNSILLECSKLTSLERLYHIIKDCFNSINDAIALNEFDILLRARDESYSSELNLFLDRLAEDTMNLDRTVSLIINIADADKLMLKSFINHYCSINPKKINMIFNLDNKDTQRASDILKNIITEFSRQKIKINIRNLSMGSAPYIKGKAGIYTYDEEDWRVYQKNVKGNVYGLACSQTEIAININRFFEVYKTDTEFRQAIINASKVLLQANTIQRRKSNEYFRSINILNNPNSPDFYRYSRNYIRFWNYDWHKDMKDNHYLFELIKSTKELVDNFCYSEETIFKSCGVPIRFKIVFSSAFRNFDPVFMGERDYKKANVKGVADFYKGEINDFITIREKMFELFDGGDRLRIFRTTDFKPEDIVHEWSVILSTFKIPFFTYDFSGLVGMVKLTNFI